MYSNDPRNKDDLALSWSFDPGNLVKDATHTVRHSIS